MKLVSLLGLSILFTACNNEPKEDVVNEVNKNGAIETSVGVEHIDSLQDVLITKHFIWKNGTLIKTTEYRDTIASLGYTTTTAENADGDEKTVTVKKDYEIFITVK
jgi:hypothetical protein